MNHYDVVVIGSGPGGASLAHKLASTGKRILLLERGDYLQREPANWDSKTVFVDGMYQTSETWYGGDGRKFHPGLHYYVGGNSKVYGAALFRLRERDFGELQHKAGVSPAWPLNYSDFEPYYGEAERVPRPRRTRRRSLRASIEHALPLPACVSRAAHSGTSRLIGEGRFASVSLTAWYSSR